MTPPNNSPKAQEVKLLPCPFCGKDPHFELAAISEGDEKHYLVRCKNPACAIGSEFEGCFDWAWNTRASNENQASNTEKAPTTPNASSLSQQEKKI